MNVRFRAAAAACALALGLLAPGARADEPVNLNTASEAEIEKLPGVGVTGARKIVEYRDQNGPFNSLEDLQKIKGLPTGTIERIRGAVVVGPGAGPGGSSQTVSAMAEGGGDATSEQVRQVLARYKNEPTVREVQEAAMRYAEVHPEVMAGWRTRARVAALGPQLRSEYRYGSDNDERLKQGGAEADSRQTDLGTENRVVGRAQWDLDRLIFNSDELRVANQVTDLVRLRESVQDQATKLYYERRRLQVDLDLTPPRDLAGRVRKELRLQELAADLDALTGGFFSRKLAERGLQPY